MYVAAAVLTAKPGLSGELGETVRKTRDIMAKATGKQVYAWSALQGQPLGTFMITARYDSSSDYMSFMGKIQDDADYGKARVKNGELMAGPAQMFNNRIIATAGYTKATPIISLTTAVMNTPITNAIAWSVDVLEFNTGVMGSGGFLTTATAGSFLTVGWTMGFESAEQMDEAQAKLDASPDATAKMDPPEGMFVPGSGQRVLAVQLP